LPLAAAGYSIKSRDLPFLPSGGHLEYKIEFAGGFPPPDISEYSNSFNVSHLQGSQITESVNHPEWRKVVIPPISDVGGDFTSRTKRVLGKADVKYLSGSRVAGSQTITANYSGPMFPCDPSLMQYPAGHTHESSDEALMALGTTAIAKCKPTNAVADASVFLGELLHEGLPHMLGSTLKTWRDKTFSARKAAGSEYLGYEFGWKPIQRDIGKFLYAVRHAEEVLAQYERDAGKVVRRRFEFPTELTTVYSDLGSAGIAITDDVQELHNGPRGKCLKTRVTGKRQWFSGAFTYYIPKGYSSREVMGRNALEAKKLYGLSLTPETVWNLAPWSWAVDWVSNAGDVVSNLSDWATDGLVLKHGYIMETSFLRDTYEWYGPVNFWTKEYPSTFTVESVSKLRRRATPFGFGLTFGDFSPRQWAIAIALGLTKW